MAVHIARQSQDPTSGVPGRPEACGPRGRSHGAVGTCPGLSTGALPRVAGGLAESVTLARDSTASCSANLLVQRLCREVGLSRAVVQEAALLAGEVVDNAVRHAQGTPHLSVVVSPAGVYVEVKDDSMTLPSAPSAPSAPGSPGTRGVAMLQSWADAWGSCAQGAGKVVWFEVLAT